MPKCMGRSPKVRKIIDSTPLDNGDTGSTLCGDLGCVLDSR